MIMQTYQLVAAGIDTEIINVHGNLPEELAVEFDELKRGAQDVEDDLATRFTFAGQTLFIKPHGSQRQWRWILHCPYLHLDLGPGKRNHIICKARLASVLLWERGADAAITLLYSFLVELLGGEYFRLQVSEAHLCADIAGWEMTVEEAQAFITLGHKRKVREAHGDEESDDSETPTDSEDTPPGLEINLYGRRCTGFEFSKGAAHSCCLYDKTKELAKSRKEWMQAVWEQNGWDGEARVVRVEFRYKRECLRELGVECPYELFDQLAGMWAYSTAQWLRHTVPADDTNRGRWLMSPFWQVVQSAEFFGDPTPLVRGRRTKGDLTLICQMMAGCATTAAAYLAGALPATDDGSVFLRWFYEWMAEYLEQKGSGFADIKTSKRLRLGIPDPLAA
jgi:hypothetical protein